MKIANCVRLAEAIICEIVAGLNLHYVLTTHEVHNCVAFCVVFTVGLAMLVGIFFKNPEEEDDDDNCSEIDMNDDPSAIDSPNH